MTRAILACAGRVPDPKWNNYLGVPKHLAPVDGQPLLHRTINQLVDRGVDDIMVVAPPIPFQKQYIHSQVSTISNVNSLGGSVNEYTTSRPCWSVDNRTVLLLGDVLFTHQAMDTILTDTHPIRWFGRMGPSRITGTRYGEIFAVAWDPDMHEKLDTHLKTVVETTQIRRPPGWKLYRSFHGAAMSRHQQLGDWTEINDETDDFDFPRDYNRHPAVKRNRR